MRPSKTVALHAPATYEAKRRSRASELPRAKALFSSCIDFRKAPPNCWGAEYQAAKKLIEGAAEPEILFAEGA